jgi:hypothetical protein
LRRHAARKASDVFVGHVEGLAMRLGPDSSNGRDPQPIMHSDFTLTEQYVRPIPIPQLRQELEIVVVPEGRQDRHVLQEAAEVDLTDLSYITPIAAAKQKVRSDGLQRLRGHAEVAV